MTTESDGLKEPVWTPEDYDYNELYKSALERLNDISGSSPGSITERGKVVDEWIEAAAKYEAENDVKKTERDRAVKNIADISDVTVTGIRDQLDSSIDSLKQNDKDEPPVDEVIEYGLLSIRERRTTDKKTDTTWVWTIEYHNQEVSIETEATKDGIQHFKSGIFRKKLYEATGYRPAPAQIGDGEWKEWIVEFIQQYREVSEIVGTRTGFVDDITEYVVAHPAYSDLEESMETGKMYLNEDDADIYVPGDVCDRLLSNRGLTANAAYNELDLRGLTSDRVEGVSKMFVRTINGQTLQRRYWVLDLSSGEIDRPETIDPGIAEDKEEDERDVGVRISPEEGMERVAADTEDSEEDRSESNGEEPGGEV